MPERVSSVSLFRDEPIHREDCGLPRENLLGENTMDFLVGIEARVFEDDASEIEVGGAAQRGEGDAAGGNSEEHQILDAARAQHQVQLVLRERADALFVDYEIFRARDGAVEFGGGRADYEEIAFLHALEAGFGIWNFRMACGKAQSHVDDVKLLLAREFHGFGRGGNDGFGGRDKSKNAFLEIESKQRCLFRIKLHGSPFLVR
jgi:hypothetical protein